MAVTLKVHYWVKIHFLHRLAYTLTAFKHWNFTDKFDHSWRLIYKTSINVVFRFHESWMFSLPRFVLVYFSIISY